MELKNLFKVSAIAVGLTLAGCGGDINVTPTVNDSSVNNSNNTTNNNNNPDTSEPPADENPCASYGELQGNYDGTDCTYNASFASSTVEITEDLSLDALENGGVHYFLGSLIMGEGCNTVAEACTVEVNGPTLTVEAGATVVFDNASSRVQINRGANIVAEGTYAAPVTFTSAKAYSRLDTVGNGASPQDWGGIMIDGFGITDQCTDAERSAGTCNAESEGAVTYYGGSDNTDNSGSLRFVKIHYAGGLPAGAEEGNDLNSLSLFAVGSGTTIEYIDIYAGYDDGIELFGGAVDLKYIVVTDTQDDSIDIDAGWQGNAQFILAKHGTVVNANGEVIAMGNNGFESDGEKGDSSAEAPASAPHIANVTVITTDNLSVRDTDPSTAVKLDDNISATWYNGLLVKAVDTQSFCFDISGDAVDNVVANVTSFQNSVAACATLSDDTDLTAENGNTTTVTAWFEGGNSEVTGGNADVLAGNGFATATGSADITVSPFDVTTLGDFFTAVDFIGAVSDTDTSSDWYNWAKDAFDNSNDE
ncbi:hypothetical protein [Planctobacterium marinum]|uniref:hypothetical protein n=1 Tax=Planctobacterium marinum TaxID=1631968 RepID=UPI001E3AA184|nr:hypothetical protein [Planctobacterium marinum]MCC2604978.1 hypothetical protein [Planctobacterium marinum]